MNLASQYNMKKRVFFIIFPLDKLHMPIINTGFQRFIILMQNKIKSLEYWYIYKAMIDIHSMD